MDDGGIKKWPWIAGHTVLLAHARVVALYRQKYIHYGGNKTHPGIAGKIGITNNAGWSEPKTDSMVDVAAAERCMIMNLAWYSDPVYFGDYPETMKRILGVRC
jgi:beta-glucosidase